MRTSQRLFPVELAIGESVPILWQFGWPRESSYAKDIVFLDVYTGLGVFLFGPDGSFLIGPAVPKLTHIKALTELEDSKERRNSKRFAMKRKRTP